MLSPPVSSPTQNIIPRSLSWAERLRDQTRGYELKDIWNLDEIVGFFGKLYLINHYPAKERDVREEINVNRSRQH